VSEYKHWHMETDEDQLLWLAFDRAGSPVNSLSREVFAELDDILNVLVKNPPKGMAIISGKEKGFIAGADISEFVDLKTADEAFELIRQAQIILDKLEAMPFPTVACIDGFCLGGGCELALACKYRIASDDPSTKIGLPEVKLGIHPGWGGTVRMPLLVGVVNAMKIMLTGASFSGRAMKRMGAVDACVPVRELKRAARYYLLNQPAQSQPKWHERLPALPFLRQFIGNIFYSQLKKKKVVKSHYPAPYAIVRNWVRDGARGNAMINEAKSIAELMITDTARNLVRVFFLQTAMKKVAKGSDFKPKHVHVIGAGMMGGDIAAYCAYKGFYVTLQDQSPERIAPAIGRAYKLFKKKLKKPNLIQMAMDRLQPDVEGRGVARADIVIEAVFEDLKVKQAIFTEVEKKAKPTALLASNTSTILIEKIAEGMQHPDRLVGIHFFNPVAKMPLVEVVYGKDTRPELTRDAAKFVTKISRSPIAVKSSPGFLINRILMPYLMEAMKLLEEGYKPEEIDYAATQFGMPMGPVTLADMVGLDICMHAAKELINSYGGELPDRLKAMVAAGDFGVKSGKGFYTYKNGKAIKSSEQTAPRDLDILTDRLVLIMVNEAVACLHENVIDSKDSLDIGMIFGTGFAPFRGGPIHYAEKRGMAEIVRTLESLEKKFGERFKPQAGWDQLMKPNATAKGGSSAAKKPEVEVEQQ
jgi:3-hydroxyacyl-CoA dehydrogenase/enoyl-CoA hydratase/3-hydroxybutyryl-CoA epimerase